VNSGTEGVDAEAAGIKGKMEATKKIRKKEELFLAAFIVKGGFGENLWVLV
jgi:hypothetical protein